MKKTIKPTKEEIAFLKMLQPEWEWIAKNGCGTVSIFRYDKPKKDEKDILWMIDWYLDAQNLYSLVKLDFDFLSWEDEEPTNIQELIKEYGNE